MFAAAVALNAYAPVLGLAKAIPTRNGPLFGTIFVVLGAYLAASGLERRVAFWAAIAASGFLMQIAEAFFLSRVYGAPFGGYDFLFGTLAFGVGSFGVVKSLSSGRPSAILERMGQLALGMYCVHILVLQIVRPFFEPNGVAASGFVTLASMSLVVASISAAISLAFSRIPYLRAVVS